MKTLILRNVAVLCSQALRERILCTNRGNGTNEHYKAKPERSEAKLNFGHVIELSFFSAEINIALGGDLDSGSQISGYLASGIATLPNFPPY